MPDLDPALRQLVRLRAAGLCEYRLISQTFTLAEHEVDHIIAIKHGAKPSPRISPYAARTATDTKGATYLQSIPHLAV